MQVLSAWPGRPGGGDAAHDERAADRQAGRHALAEQRHRPGHADQRFQVQQQAGPRARQAGDGQVPGQHAHHVAADGQERQLTPGGGREPAELIGGHRRGEGGVKRAARHGGRGRRRHRAAGPAQRPEHQGVRGEEQGADRDQAHARELPAAAPGRQNAGAGQHRHPGQGNRRARPAPPAHPLAQEGRRQQQQPDRLAGQHQPGGGGPDPLQPDGDRQVIADHAQQPRDDQPRNVLPPGASQHRTAPGEQDDRGHSHPEHEQRQRRQLQDEGPGGHGRHAPDAHRREPGRRPGPRARGRAS